MARGSWKTRQSAVPCVWDLALTPCFKHFQADTTLLSNPPFTKYSDYAITNNLHLWLLGPTVQEKASLVCTPRREGIAKAELSLAVKVWLQGHCLLALEIAWAWLLSFRANCWLRVIPLKGYSRARVSQMYDIVCHFWGSAKLLPVSRSPGNWGLGEGFLPPEWLVQLFSEHNCSDSQRILSGCSSTLSLVLWIIIHLPFILSQNIPQPLVL